MKKRALCALLVLVLAFSLLPVPAYAEDYVKIDRSNFPDPGFRDYVAQFDTEEPKGFLSTREIGEIKEINIHDEDITLLRGVEFFTELIDLNCNSCSLRNLDVSKNTKLKELSCSSNGLLRLDVSKNTALQELSCYSNEITVLDLSNNKNLTYLDCDRNPLETLDVSKNTALQILMCYECKLTSLDISKNTKLKSLACYGNEIEKLDISRNPNLVKAYRKGQRDEYNGDYSYWISDGGNFYSIDLDATTSIVCVVPPKITTQPRSASVKAGSKVTFRVKATGDQLKYQWYARKPGTKKWAKVKNAVKATLTFKATAKMNGYKYRCRVYNRTASVYSKTVTLKVKK